MDVNKQSGGAGKKLMPGYKAGGPIKAASGAFVTRADKKVIAQRNAQYAAENARIAAEEARPINRLKSLYEDTSADISQGFKTKIKRPFLKAVAKAGPRIEKTLSKIPNKKAKALGLGAAALGAGAASLMGDDDEADMEMETSSDSADEARRLSYAQEAKDANRRVQYAKEAEETNNAITPVTAPVKKAASKPKIDYDKMSAMDAVIAYNKLHNKNFDKSTEQEIRDRFASPSEGGMKRGGMVSKYAGGGKAEAKGFLDKPRDSITDDRYPGKKLSIRELGAGVKEGYTNYKDMINRTGKFEPSPKDGKVSKYAGGGDATYGASMTSEERVKAKRGIDPYEDRTRGLGAMTDAEAEAASKGLREKYGKKEDKPVMHPGGRQRFLLNQTEKTPMKSGGKAEASKSDMQQDRALMARHNRLMHPDQKSKMKNGGKSVPSYSSKPLIKKSGGGGCNY
jgi:hypothetical protein